jgi:predicted O-methyltransferase YrrM
MADEDAHGPDDELPPGHTDDPLTQILIRVFGRTPKPRELEVWGGKLARGMNAKQFITQLAGSPSFAANRYVRQKNPPGHFFSPVVDPDLVVDYVAQARQQTRADVAGIDFHVEDMVAFWHANRDFIAATPFSDEPDGVNRYCFLGGPYPYGDATTLRAIIGAYRPRRVVEIGSGYSSACMLDAADHAGLTDFSLTCIEPYPTRLKSVLRPQDYRRVTIMEQGVQGADLAIFAALERNDILFIDSTHVLKTGSDVHYELFHVLPVLKPGVLIHFHDCRFPFEYSDKQIFEKNYSWNEAYGVRALLMWSNRLRVVFYNSLFALEQRELINQIYPTFLRNPGSSIWMQVQDY